MQGKQKNKFLKRLVLLIAKQYTSIGGQAVIEGVMMRSPNSFVIALRNLDGSIQLRRDQWYSISNKAKFFKWPFFRGVLMLVEAMANGIVSLNYSANHAMEQEEAEKAKENNTEVKKGKKASDKVDWQTFFTMLTSFALGIGMFVFLPHAATAGIAKLLGVEWDLDGVTFHAVDGAIKATIFLAYIFIIGFIPDIRKVFQYHGAEHKSISTFESGQELTVENARKFSTLHPRCGTSFLFFLIFISIILFSFLFTIIPIPQDLPFLMRHLYALLTKIALMLPIAGISYEIIRLAGKYPGNIACKALSTPGMMLQKLTTREPDDEQLEVALASIKTVLVLEKKIEADENKDKKVLERDEVAIPSLDAIENTNASLNDFLEA